MGATELPPPKTTHGTITAASTDAPTTGIAISLATVLGTVAFLSF
jgi:hypothetical protein